MTTDEELELTAEIVRLNEVAETLRDMAADVDRVIRDAEMDTSIDMYVIGGTFHRKGE